MGVQVASAGRTAVFSITRFHFTYCVCAQVDSFPFLSVSILSVVVNKS